MPKCIVHGAGGVLLQHLKEHQLHCDMRPGDRVFYFTTCGWMMWNWLVSALASGATLLLYDGSPFHPRPAVLFDYAEAERMTLFGTSAKYHRRDEQIRASSPADASARPRCARSAPPDRRWRPRVSTTSTTTVKEDVCLASMSGGTDLSRCFALGNPIAPVWRGELQCRGLGMARRHVGR